MTDKKKPDFDLTVLDGEPAEERPRDIYELRPRSITREIVLAAARASLYPSPKKTLLNSPAPHEPTGIATAVAGVAAGRLPQYKASPFIKRALRSDRKRRQEKASRRRNRRKK